MIKNQIVKVYTNSPISDGHHGTVQKLTYMKDISVDIQPYSTALLLKTYGYNIEVNKRIYLDCFDSNIKIGTILKYTDKYENSVSLEVKAIPWDDGYMEVMALEIH